MSCFALLLALALQGASPPLPYVPGSETVVLLPDTQYYTERFTQHFWAQTQWIRANAAERKIRMVMQLGDVTNNNTPEQWRNAKRCLEPLRGVVPFAVAMGNHDYGPNGSTTNRITLGNQYLPLDEYRQDMNVVAAFEPGKIDNLAHTFRAGGRFWLILNLEFGPRDSVLRWAEGLVRRHPGHRVIVLTHAYLFSDGNRYDYRAPGQEWNPHSYPIERMAEKPNDGAQMWDKLIRRYRTFTFVFSGHVLNDGLARLVSRGDLGNEVHQHTVNFQMNRQGGEGYLRLVEFLPDGRRVQCRTYSPSLDRYKTDPENQFVISLPPRPAIGRGFFGG